MKMRQLSAEHGRKDRTEARRRSLPNLFGTALSLNATPSQSNRNHRIVVGVDFGTTYTGISYIESSADVTTCSVKDVHDVRTYPGPGREGDAVWKTPSRIAYEHENESCQKNQFGFQVLPKMISYSWTKLLLDKKARSTEFDDPSLRKIDGDGLMRLPEGKTAGEVVTDFLSEVYTWFIAYLEKKMTAELLEITPMEFWFTVPAIWSDQAKDATINAAKKAGFSSRSEDRMFLIPEPEAAAIATIKGFSEKQSAVPVAVKDVVMVCDCGGGTVDVTSYEITEVTPMLEFEEVVEGIGGKCGSTYIDREFHRWMSDTFGSSFDELKFERIGPGSYFMKDFEMYKRDFGSDSDLDREYEIRLNMPDAGDSELYDADESTVKLTGHIMKNFFEPVIEKVIQLLNQQVARITGVGKSALLKRILLAGGFGDSPYLHQKVKAWCSTKGLSVLCAEHPQAAIARGAALRGFDCIKPVRRRSRRHYGLRSDKLFREGIDPEEKAQFDLWSNRKECTGRMDWVIAKGQLIDESTEIVRKRRRVHEEGGELTKWSTLFSCSLDVPPDYATDKAVEKVAELGYTVTKDELAKCKHKLADGKRIYRLYYTRHVYLGARQGTLLFKVFCDGEEWARSEIKYETM